MFKLKVFVLLIFVTISVALFDENDDVVILTSDNFKSEVISHSEPIMVNFYASWCHTAQILAPEYNKAAIALKDVMVLGAIDCSKQKEICKFYNIFESPTIFIFRNGKPSAIVEGQTAGELIKIGLDQARIDEL